MVSDPRPICGRGGGRAEAAPGEEKGWGCLGWFGSRGSAGVGTTLGRVCNQNPEQGLQARPQTALPSRTSGVCQQNHEQRLQESLASFASIPGARWVAKKRGRGVAYLPVPISLASTKGAQGAGGFHTAAGRRRPAWPRGPEPNRAEWQTYGADKAILIGDHCKFPSQMEWKNAIKLI